MFAINGNQIGFAKLVQGFRLSTSDGHYIPTKTEGRKSIKLKMNEIVHQVNMLTVHAIITQKKKIQEMKIEYEVEFSD